MVTKNEVKQLLRRDLPTESHKQAWKNYDRIMIHRTSLALFFTVIFELVNFMLGESRVQKSRQYIKEGKPHNKGFVDSTFPYLEVLMTTLAFGRVLILLISTKYLNVIKVVAYYELVILLIQELALPLDRGLETDNELNERLYISFI